MSSVVFMGTPDFAVGILQTLIDSSYEVTAVFTQPDRPKGRKGILQPPPVKELAQKMGIPVYQPLKIRTEENVRLLEQIDPDFIVVAAFGQIIPKAILDIPKFGCLNVHASLLPKWRGAAPIQWSILSGDSETGVTIMRMDVGLDTGDMILKRTIPIRKDETGDSLFDALMDVGQSLLLEAMAQVENGQAVYTPQPEESTTPYAKMLRRQSGLIDWSKSACEIERMVRAFNSWPGTYTFLNGKMLKIWKAEVAAGADEAGAPAEKTAGAAWKTDPAIHAEKYGEIIAAGKDELVVRTGDGLLKLTEVQPEGKKRMSTDAFLRGYHPQTGDVMVQEKS